MNRGEVYWYVGPSPAIEIQSKRRPVVIVSHNAASSNDKYPYVTVVPITSKVDKIYPLEVYLEELSKPSKAQPQNIFTARKIDMDLPKITMLNSDSLEGITLSLSKYLNI